jgi:hypothetical protein
VIALGEWRIGGFQRTNHDPGFWAHSLTGKEFVAAFILQANRIWDYLSVGVLFLKSNFTSNNFRLRCEAKQAMEPQVFFCQRHMITSLRY